MSTLKRTFQSRGGRLELVLREALCCLAARQARATAFFVAKWSKDALGLLGLASGVHAVKCLGVGKSSSDLTAKWVPRHFSFARKG